MANVINKAINKFTKGLVMDFSPENTGNEVLTHALNATFLTFNGNELSLQNDMGNARVETAFLPEGYIPVGTCEYGGIIYIVSYNPLEDKSQIGCFPSPERNISNDELGISDQVISSNNFQEFNGLNPTGKIKNSSYQVLLKNDKLNPGDKFLIKCSDSIYEEALSDLYIETEGTFNLKEHPLISLNIVSIEDSGKIIYLNNNVRYYDKLHDGKNYKYHFIGDEQSNISEITDIDLDSYRNVLSSGYNVFKSKTSGKLAILAELVMIDSYSVSHSIHQIPNSNSNSNLGDQFEINLHIDVSPSIDEKNINPVLKYHYLKNSQGYLQAYSDSSNSVENKLLFTDNNDNKINGTLFSDVYMLTKATDQNLLENKSFSQDNFNFPKSDQYISAINDNKYSDLKLGQLNFPKIISNNSWNLPFKYDYTLVPCMEYGRLEHLAVSNTIDFSNMRDFNKSNFNTWKYRIDGNQLRITFSTDIYDTFEEDKVDALVLEFYDHRGFAGSLEISGKKSYSGQFTKILYLNTVDALSKNKINNAKDNYITDFKRNINIIKKSNKYYLNDDPVNYIDDEKGWVIRDENNDCGIIYPNVAYGIKTYLRRTTTKGFEFIPKKEFILYTLPIYNEYYYKISNFNVLEYPELDFVLTYKLEEDQNKSKIKTVNNGSFMINGYPNVDTLAKHYEKINSYLNNNFEGNELSVVRYYQYEGQSKLNIEVGLHQNYSECGLSYDSKINEKFNCTLKLLSNDEDKEYTVSHNKSNEIIVDI